MSDLIEQVARKYAHEHDLTCRRCTYEHTVILLDSALRELSAKLEGECICQGNWRLIVKESEPLLGTQYADEAGRVFKFFGLVHAPRDYYYGMYSKEHGLRMLSCVGSIEGHGFTALPAPPRKAEETTNKLLGGK